MNIPVARARRIRILTLFGGLVCLIGILHLRFTWVVVSGDSMLPTLATGDLLILDKFASKGTTPSRGAVVVAKHHNELIVKRVVGLPGEEVELKMGRLFINGNQLFEPYKCKPGNLQVGKGTLFAGTFALVGDNRDLATAITAVVPIEKIIGMVRFAICLSRYKVISPNSKTKRGSPEQILP